MFRQLSEADGDRVTLDEVPTIVSCLNLPEATSKLRERAFEALAEVIWQSGQPAKDLVVDNKGIEALVQSMWQDMGNAPVQASAVELLFALAASPDGATDTDVLTEMNRRALSMLSLFQCNRMSAWKLFSARDAALFVVLLRLPQTTAMLMTERYLALF